MFLISALLQMVEQFALHYNILSFLLMYNLQSRIPQVPYKNISRCSVDKDQDYQKANENTCLFLLTISTMATSQYSLCLG